MKGQIFISYRRDDSLGYTGRIYDRLLMHFQANQIFMDVDTIEPGADFVDAIEMAVDKCDILIAVIGSRWLNARDKKEQRSLDNPEDFVRIEIRHALEKNIRVIPVLLDNAIMPISNDLPDDLKSLSRRNAIEIRHTHFTGDAERLTNFLKKSLNEIEAKKKAEIEKKKRIEEERNNKESNIKVDEKQIEIKKNKEQELMGEIGLPIIRTDETDISIYQQMINYLKLIKPNEIIVEDQFTVKLPDPDPNPITTKEYLLIILFLIGSITILITSSELGTQIGAIAFLLFFGTILIWNAIFKSKFIRINLKEEKIYLPGDTINFTEITKINKKISTKDFESMWELSYTKKQWNLYYQADNAYILKVPATQDVHANLFFNLLKKQYNLNIIIPV